jgi:hypothetical protein
MNATTREFLRTWAHTWRFPDLWVAVLYDEELDDVTVARRAAQSLVSLPSPKEALEGLLAIGEMEAATRLLSNMGFNSDPDVPQDRVAFEARLTEEMRKRAEVYERTMAALERRGRRYGFVVPPTPRNFPARWKDAKKVLDDIAYRVDDAVRRGEIELSEPPRAPVNWAPPPLIAWPVPNASPQVATGWFLGRGSPPPVLTNLIPDRADEDAWRVIRALDDLCTTPGRRWSLDQATTFVAAVAAMVGAEAGQTRQQGEGFASDLYGLDERTLPSFPDPPGTGLAFWLSARGDSKGQETFGERFRIAFLPERDFVRRPNQLRLDVGMLLAVSADRPQRRARLFRAWARDVPLTRAIPEGICHARSVEPGPSLDDFVARLLGWLDVSIETADVMDRLSWYSGGRVDLACSLLRVALGGLRGGSGSPRATLTVADVESAWEDDRFIAIGHRCLEEAGPAAVALVEAAVLLDDASIAGPIPASALVHDASELGSESPLIVEEAVERLVAVGALEYQGGELRLPLDGLGGLVRRAVGVP